MTLQLLPPAKLPNWNVPTVRGLPTIPRIGCVGGNATTIVGEQMGNLPDLATLPHVKALQKVITEQIGTLVEGQLGVIPRAPLYAARQLRLIQELQEMITMATQTANQIASEINAAIGAANQRIADLNASKAAITATPAVLRNAVQRKALGRYNQYVGEINGQIARLERSLECLM